MRNLRLLMAGQSVSAMGDILYTVAAMAYVYGQTGSSAGTASVLVVKAVAQVLAGFGVVQVVDRFPRRRMMILADLLRAVTMGLLALAGALGHFSLVAIYLAEFVLSGAQAFFAPASAALLPQVVRKTELVRANGLVSTALQVVYTGGWAAGGLLVALLGAPMAILLNGVSFLAAASCSAALRLQEEAPEGGQRQSPFQGLRAGWDQVWGNPVVRTVTLMDLLELAANVVWSSPLLLAYTFQVLGADEVWWGWQISVYFLGTIIGGAIAVTAAQAVSRWGGWAIGGGSAVASLFTLGYVFNRSPVMALLLSFVQGPPYQIRDLLQQSMLQASLPAEAMGRAFAARNMLFNLLTPLAVFGMGLLADRAGVTVAYGVATCLYAISALMAVGSQPVRTYRLAAAEQTQAG